MPVTQTFTASRNATWSPLLAYPYPGAALPIAGATIEMQLRLYPGADGDPLLSLTFTATDTLQSGTEGGDDELRLLTLDPGAGWSTTQLDTLPGATKQQMAALAVIANLPTPPGPEVGQGACLFFDIRITYTDGVSEILSSGTFTVSPGVTTDA